MRTAGADGPPELARFRLTASGERVLRGRRREFEQRVRAVRAVLPREPAAR